MSKKRRRKPKRSTPPNERQANNLFAKKAQIARLMDLIGRIEKIMSVTTGPRYFTYKLRRHQVEIAIKAIRRSMRDRPIRNARTLYVVNPKSIQGGAPGLIQQRR